MIPLISWFIGYAWGRNKMQRLLEGPPPWPPNFTYQDGSTGVPPPPFARAKGCPCYHYPDTRCRMCEALVAGNENRYATTL